MSTIAAGQAAAVGVHLDNIVVSVNRFRTLAESAAGDEGPLRVMEVALSEASSLLARSSDAAVAMLALRDPRITAVHTCDGVEITRKER